MHRPCSVCALLAGGDPGPVRVGPIADLSGHDYGQGIRHSAILTVERRSQAGGMLRRQYLPAPAAG